MLEGIYNPISAALGIENKTLFAAAPCLVAGSLYAGAASAAIGLRAASIATEYLGQDDLSDRIEELRADLVSLARRNIQYVGVAALGLTALTTSAVALHGYFNPPVVEDKIPTFLESYAPDFINQFLNPKVSSLS